MDFKNLNEELKKFLEYHNNIEDIGTIDVTWIGIEKDDNEEDTIFFSKDLDTDEYFYRSEEYDGDGFKTLKDAQEDAKKHCEKFNKEFFKGVKFSKFNKD